MTFSDSHNADIDMPDWLPGHEPYWQYETFGGDGELVCSECIADPAVREKVCCIHDKAECGYCGGTLGPFVEDTVVFEYVYRCLGQEYSDPSYSPLIRDEEEDSWFGIKQLDTVEVLWDEEPFASGSEVEAKFAALVEHDWYRLDSEVGEYHEQLIWGWDSFERRLIDGPRFLFSVSEAEMGGVSIQSLFEFLEELSAEVKKFNFVDTYKAGSELFRARADERALTSPEELGSPDPSITGNQRMSAAGVSCYYAAEDPTTARKEVVVKEKEQLSVGRWATTRELTYADFAVELELPSLFDYPLSEHRPYVLFLREFVERISQPADPRVGDANAYLATQVLAEYLRFGFPRAGGYGLDAVRYPSTANEGGVNWVIFGRPDQQDPPSIKFISPIAVSD